MPDELNRDNLYSAGADGGDGGNDDDAELELEPLDPDLLSAEKRRAEEAVSAVKATIDIDEVYRDAEASRETEILEGWFKNFRSGSARFQFQVKHLLLATAVLAILLTLKRFEMLGTVLVLAVMFGVGGVTLYLQWQEKKRREEADRRRQKMYAQRRAHLARKHGRVYEEPDEPAAAPALDANPLPPDNFEEARKQAAEKKQFRLQFSLGQFMIAMVSAATVLALVRVFGGPQNVATLCGLVALIGLVVHACGVEPPELVVLGWWIMLLLYVALSILAMFWSGFGGA